MENGPAPTTMTLPGYEVPGKEYGVTYLALGAGVQSTALLLMSNLGLYDCPKADYAIFADTGAEPESVYRTVSALQKCSTIPVVVVQEGDLEEEFISGAVHAEGHFSNLPLFTSEEQADGTIRKGFSRRGCTADYKLKPIHRYLKREVLGLRPRQRVKTSVRAMMGISWDETRRVKPSTDKWCDLSYPLVDNQIRREKCLRILEEHGPDYPTPSRSACYFCPFHGEVVWKNMKENDPEMWERACAFDEAIRDQSKTGLRGKAYLHRSCAPLRSIDLTHGGQTEFEFMGCESGYCGV